MAVDWRILQKADDFLDFSGLLSRFQVFHPTDVKDKAVENLQKNTTNTLEN